MSDTGPFSWLPPQLVVALLAALPFAEIRLAMPVGLYMFKMPIPEVFFWSQLGSALPPVIVYAIGERWIAHAERRHGWIHRAIRRVVRETRHKMADRKVKVGGLVALALFVGTPLPGTGAWSGGLGAFLLHIPLKRALPAIIAGNIIAGVIMMLGLTGAVSVFRIFL